MMYVLPLFNFRSNFLHNSAQSLLLTVIISTPPRISSDNDKNILLSADSAATVSSRPLPPTPPVHSMPPVPTSPTSLTSPPAAVAVAVAQSSIPQSAIPSAISTASPVRSPNAPRSPTAAKSEIPRSSPKNAMLSKANVVSKSGSNGDDRDNDMTNNKPLRHVSINRAKSPQDDGNQKGGIKEGVHLRHISQRALSPPFGTKRESGSNDGTSPTNKLRHISQTNRFGYAISPSSSLSASKSESKDADSPRSPHYKKKLHSIANKRESMRTAKEIAALAKHESEVGGGGGDGVGAGAGTPKSPGNKKLRSTANKRGSIRTANEIAMAMAEAGTSITAIESNAIETIASGDDTAETPYTVESAEQTGLSTIFFLH
jgi:hypothetical protein